MSDIDTLGTYPFERLRRLLRDIPSKLEPINLTIGEPRVAPPPMVTEILATNNTEWNRYPPIMGIPELQSAIRHWLYRRFHLQDFGSSLEVEATCGSREGLFLAAMLTRFSDKSHHTPKPQNLIAVPNPGYAVYAGSARIAGAELLALNNDNGRFPDPDSLTPAQLGALRLVYLCSPDNPSGALLPPDTIRAWITAARKHDFFVLGDECYSELYADKPPISILNVATEMGHTEPFDRVLCTNSLSKRSSSAGLRSGLLAGDPRLIAQIRALKSYAGGRMPLAIQHTSTALWQDEAHVETIRQHYRDNYALVKRLNLGIVEAGMFLWLPVQDDEATAQYLWREGGLRTIPGSYLCESSQTAPGKNRLRIALVHDVHTLEPALETLSRLINN